MIGRVLVDAFWPKTKPSLTAHIVAWLPQTGFHPFAAALERLHPCAEIHREIRGTRNPGLPDPAMAMRATVGGSRPNAPSPAKASPESLIRMRDFFEDERGSSFSIRMSRHLDVSRPACAKDEVPWQGVELASANKRLATDSAGYWP